MSSPVRGSKGLWPTASPLLLSAVLMACNFPDYAFRDAQVGSTSGRGGNDSPGGGAGATVQGGAGGISAGAGGATSEAGRAGQITAGGAGAGGSGTGGSFGAGLGGAGAGGRLLGAAGEAGSTSSGTLLFSDDFEAGQAARWQPGSASDWSVASTSASHVYRQATKGDALRLSSAGDLAWTDQVLEARIRVLSFGGSTTSDLAFLAVRFRDPDDFYYAALRADGKVVLKARLNGTDSSLGASVNAGITTNTWYTTRVVAAGAELSVYVNDTLIQSVPGVLIAAGSIAVGSNNATVEFDDVSVTVP